MIELTLATLIAADIAMAIVAIYTTLRWLTVRKELERLRRNMGI